MKQFNSVQFHCLDLAGAGGFYVAALQLQHILITVLPSAECGRCLLMDPHAVLLMPTATLLGLRSRI